MILGAKPQQYLHPTQVCAQGVATTGFPSKPSRPSLQLCSSVAAPSRVSRVVIASKSNQHHASLKPQFFRNGTRETGKAERIKPGTVTEEGCRFWEEQIHAIPVRAYGWMESQAPGRKGLRDVANDRPHSSTCASWVASNASIKGSCSRRDFQMHQVAAHGEWWITAALLLQDG